MIFVTFGSGVLAKGIAAARMWRVLAGRAKRLSRHGIHVVRAAEE
jgi:hypothetical protein